MGDMLEGPCKMVAMETEHAISLYHEMNMMAMTKITRYEIKTNFEINFM